MAKRSHQSAGGRREVVLRLLRERRRPMAIMEIADLLGIHVNTVRFHLEALEEHGQVERATAEHRGPGRPPQVFSAVVGMDPEGPRHYELLADILAAGYAAAPQSGLRASEAGRNWGRRLADAGDESGAVTAEASVDQLMRVLNDLDFAPELRGGEGLPVIGLRHCPFLDLARSRAEVVCPVHLGLMRGVLEASGSALTVDRLEAFVEPDLCATHLAYVEAG